MATFPGGQYVFGDQSRRPPSPGCTNDRVFGVTRGQITVIQLLLLGSVDIFGDSGARMDAPLRRSKRVALLAFLAAARPTGFHRRDKIAALFWPELPTDRARAALRTTLSRLRDDHGAELVLGRGVDEIAVDIAQLRCDVMDFDDAMAASRFEDAVALYRGPFLDGVHVEGAGEQLENWIATERSRLHDGLLRALSALVDAAERRGDLEAAVSAARQSLDASPNDEVLARRAISLLIASGNRGGAMQAYDEFVRRLRSDLDVDPAPETSALVAPLRTRAETASVDRPRHAGPKATPLVSGVPGPAAGPARSPRSSRVLTFTWIMLVIVGVAAVVTTVAKRNVTPITATPSVAWQEVAYITRPAPAAFGARAVLDSTGDALLVFGGIVDRDRKIIAPLGESYWRLRGLGSGDAAAWTQLRPAKGLHPVPRWLFGVSSDAARDRVVIHGGATGFTSPCVNDTWVLNHASGIGGTPSWRRVQTRGTVPEPRSAFDQVYDASRRRLIVFGGNDCVYPRIHETWVLAFDDSTLVSGTWARLTPDTSAGVPMRRDGFVAAYDTTAARMYVFGGRAEAVPTGELWALDNASGDGGRPAWRPISCRGDHPIRMAPAAALDVEADTWTLVHGADQTGQSTRTVWRIHGLLRDVAHCRWEQLAFAEPSPAGRTAANGALLSRARGMFIFGGEFANTALSDAWVLKPVPRR